MTEIENEIFKNSFVTSEKYEWHLGFRLDPSLKSLEDIFTAFRARGVTVEVAPDIDLNRICRNSPNAAQPRTITIDGEKSTFSALELITILSLIKLDHNINAFLSIVDECISSDKKEMYFISPVKYLLQDGKPYYIFCIFRKDRKGNSYLNINGLPDQDFSTPVISSKKGIIGFCHHST